MDLTAINSNLLGEVSKKLGLTTSNHQLTSPAFLSPVVRFLSNGTETEGSVEVVFRSLENLGVEMNHLEIEKVLNGDPVHSYLLLDIVNLLIDFLLSDNPDISSYIRKFQQKQQLTLQRFRGKQGSSLSEDDDGLNVTSGGEEISRIIQEARLKYGRIRPSFRTQIDKENISMIHKLDDKQTQPVGQDKVDNRKPPLTKNKSRRDQKGVGAKKSLVTDSTVGSSLETATTASSQSRTASSHQETTTSTSGHAQAGPTRKSGKRKRKKSTSPDHEVNIRIPLEDASVNVCIRPGEPDQTLENRRIHIRVKQASPKKGSKKIVYGTKSVLYHHHRKNRPPLFSRQLSPPKLSPVPGDKWRAGSDKPPSLHQARMAVAQKTVKTVTSARDARKRAKLKDKLDELPSQPECPPQRTDKSRMNSLAVDRYVREVRTENVHLKRALAKARKKD